MSEYQAGPSGSDEASASLVTQAHEKVQQTAHQASSTAATALRGRVETQAGQVSRELQSVATAMRRTGHSLHAEGNDAAAKVVDGLIERMESVANYLGQSSGDRMLHDVERFGRRKPWAMIGAGVSLGFLASRFLKASSRDRYQGPQHQPSTAQGGSSQHTRATMPPATSVPPVPAAAHTIGGAPVTAR